jgi:hypothetical protein
MKIESLIELYKDMLRRGELPKDPQKVTEDQKLQIRAGILKKRWWKEDREAEEGK